ncbi:hypothetical protein RirG_163120 [Rhizophagus irregularis DAOM 197198w]|uniref:Uncharacterized protein n=1 Tax=Rhizophagus irregularis (strain DAOM 197198w) TaxID=1432141 RepID=A0A015KR31_RHIIW|nr:hypothetical protein RirG_163120 [Rhizophagus irregularis DAOM 197198w]
MQKIVDIANDFYLINDININVKKSEMIIINPSVERHEQVIELGHDRFIVQATNDEIRYLGVWFSNKPSRRRWMQHISTTVKSFCDTVRRKFVPAGQCIYLINRVLIPRLIYIAQIMTLSEHDWNQVFAPVMKLVKNWMKLPKNTPSSLLFHEGCLGMDHPWKIHYINIITDLTIKLNSDSYAAIATQIRLRDAQLKSLIIDLIFNCDLHATSWIKLQARKNVPFNALVIAKSLDISMAIDLIDRSTWSISGGKELILKFFKQYQLTKGIHLMI